MSYELPGFEIDFDDSLQLDVVDGLDEVSSQALGSVEEEIEASGIAYELEELLPPDARDLIDDMLVGDFVDTIYLVGWKLGQPRRQMLSSLAEQVAGYVLLQQAEATLDRDDAPLSVAGADQARQEIEDLKESILDEMFLHEYLPGVEAYELADLVPAEVGSRRASLWAPWYLGKGEPPPRATGDDEPEWSLREGSGVTPRQAVAASGEEGSEEAERRLPWSWRSSSPALLFKPMQLVLDLIRSPGEEEASGARLPLASDGSPA